MSSIRIVATRETKHARTFQFEAALHTDVGSLTIASAAPVDSRDREQAVLLRISHLLSLPNPLGINAIRP